MTLNRLAIARNYFSLPAVIIVVVVVDVFLGVVYLTCSALTGKATFTVKAFTFIC